MSRISIIRRTVQMVCFAIIVFGGFLFGPALRRGEILTESGYSGTFERSGGIVRWVEREKVAVNAFLPVTSCYYQHKGMFSGCSLLFLSEHLAWLTPLMQIVPQLLLLLLLVFAFGRLWCGWVCPFGLLSDILTFLRRIVGADHIRLSRRCRDGLVWTKYGLLALSLGLSLLIALPAVAEVKSSLLHPFCQVCFGKFASPFLSIAEICWTNWTDWITSTLTILGLVVFVTFFLGLAIRRFYCRICPIGGITAPFNRVGLSSLQKDAAKCTKCGACARVCPVDNLSVYEGKEGQPVDACECTLCLRCVEACPEPGCLRFTLVGKHLVSS